jgi:hypothetical protein
MAEEMRRLQVAVADREAFALCLALGTLEAIRSEAWTTEAGIWTLSRPVFREELDSIGMPEEVLDVFRSADELSLLEQLAGREAVEQKLQVWVSVLQARLATLPERCWYARWEDGASR